MELNIVKEQYKRMSDDELIRLAKDESIHLTIESFHLLSLELESRKLDTNAIENAQIDRDLAAATKLSEFEKTTAAVYTETIWKFAFDQKEKGKNNVEIFNSLIKRNIQPEYAYMLVESLESKAREIAGNFDTEIIIGWIALISGGLLIFVVVNSDSIRKSFILWGAILAFGGILRLTRSITKKRKFQNIVNNIESEREIENNLFQ